MKQKYSLNEMQDLIRNQIIFKHNKIEAYYDNQNNYQVRYNYNLIFKYDLVKGINNTERKVYVGDL